MEERFGTQPAIHQRGILPNKLLQGLSHFKGIIRMPGRKTKDDRDLDRYPYSPRASTTRSSTIAKPYMSQPLLGLVHQASKSSQNDGDVLKFSACVEQSPSHEEIGMQNEKTPPSIPSVHHDLQPRTSAQNKPHDHLPPRSPSLQSMPKLFSGLINSVQDGSRKNIDVPSSVGSPLSVQEVASTTLAHSATSTPSLSHKAQPVSKYPTARCDGERPSTADSVQTPSNGADVKTGLSLNAKRSFSQLRLNVKTKQNSDLTCSSPKPSPKSTNIPSTPTSAVIPLSSLKSLPPTPAVKPAVTPLISSPSVPPTTNETSTSSSNPRTSTSMTSASTHIHKPLPPMGRTLPNLAKGKPPKLTLAPLNHRLSFNFKTPIATEGGLARLSPTIITRPPPLPLLNLPTLSPRSDSLTEASTAFNFNARGRLNGSGKVGEGGSFRSREDRERSLRKSQLKSMPALPRKGSGWGVRAYEETDDFEDESVDEDEDYEENSSRNDVTSRSGLLAPDLVADSTRSSFESSTSSLASLDQRDNLLPPSLFGRGRSYRTEEEEAGTYSSGDSSYHSAHSTAYPSPRPEFAAISSVPRIKYPTPPRGYGQGRGHAAPSEIAASAPAPQASTIQNRWVSHVRPSRLASSDSQPSLPEVDAARINIFSFPSSSPSPTIIDVKGKGKARDRSASPLSSASGSIVTGGTTPTAATLTNQAVIEAFDPYSYHADDDFSNTPIATTVRNGFGCRGSGYNDMHAHVQSQKRLGKLNSRGSLAAMPNEVEPSPTATVRQQYASYVSGTVGGGNNEKGGEGGGEEHISEQNASTAGSQTSPSALQRHSVPHNSPSLTSPLDSISQNRPALSRHSTYHPSTRKPRNTSPASSFGLQTPKARSPGMKHTVDHFPLMATKRSSNLLYGGPGGDGGTGFRKPRMYQRASQSMIDIHTLQTREKRKKLEEDARAEEERELMKLKQKKKKDEKRRLMKDEKAKDKEDEKSRDEDEKIKVDDDNSSEAKEREDKLGPPVKTALASKNANAISSPTAEGPSGLTTRLSHLRRRRSMPVFDTSTEPPPYPSFTLLYTSPASKYTVMPREDEGQERLPPYTNHIHLKAIMPRKLEFSSPGVQAKDRKWRRMMCVLEGTVLKVYKAPRGHAGVGVFGEWWEKQVGAGDVSLQPSHSDGVSNFHIETREARRAAEERREIERQIQRIIKMEGGDDVVGGAFGRVEDDVVVVEPPREENNSAPTRTLKPSRSRSRLTQLLKPGKGHNRSKSDVHQSERTTHSPSPRPSLNIPRNSGASTPVSGGSLSPFPGSGSMRAQTPISSSSQSITGSTSASGDTTTPTSTTTHSTFLRPQQLAGLSPSTSGCLFTNREKQFLPDPDPADLVKAYSLQNAESGIGNDYLKRKNVIRLRLEGEQFLLQARDVTGVVEWIEALQAATNIALDLDERPMPRGPLFPRRRRRRRAPGSSSPGASASVGSGMVVNVASIANMPLPVATV